LNRLRGADAETAEEARDQESGKPAEQREKRWLHSLQIRPFFDVDRSDMDQYP
jgi:hypothetical protein